MSSKVCPLMKEPCNPNEPAEINQKCSFTIGEGNDANCVIYQGMLAQLILAQDLPDPDSM